MPAGFSVITILGGPYKDPAGNVLSGTVSFTLSQKIANTDGLHTTIISPSTITATLDDEGTFTVDLFSNMDPTTSPSNTFYQVTENLVSSVGSQSDAQPIDYSIQVPITYEGISISSISLSLLQPGTPGGFNPPTYTVDDTLVYVAPNAGTIQWTSFLDLPEVTDWLQFSGVPIGGTAPATILQRLIDSACYRAQEIANRPLCPTTFFERHDGWSGEYIQLMFSPFIQLVECNEWQSTGGMVTLTESTPENPIDGVQINYDTSRIMRTFSGYSWPKPFFPGSRNIEVIYVAGMNPVPPDVWVAACDLVAYWYRNTQQASRGFVGSAGMYGGDEGGSGDLWPGVPNRISEVFENYRLPVIG